MSFRIFLWASIRHAFHGAWRFVEIGEVVLAVLIYASSYFFHEIKDHLAEAMLALVILGAALFLCRIFYSAYLIYWEAETTQRVVPPPPDVVKERDELRAERVKLIAERDSLQADLDTIYATNMQIFHQGESVKARRAVMEIEQTLFIEADGSFRGTETITFMVYERGIIIERDLEGDSAVSSLTDLNITVDTTDKTHKILTLPGQQTPTSKKILLVFLPGLEPANIATYSVSWKWPALWARFLNHQGDSWRHLVQSEEPVERIRFRFKLAKGLPRIKLSNIREGGGIEIPCSAPTGKDDYSEYLWEMKAVKPGSDIEIYLEKR